MRFKLAAAFMISFSALLAVLFLAGQVMLERHLRQHFDRQLIGRARQMVAVLVQSESPFSVEGLRDVIERESKSVYFRDFYVQTRDIDGSLITRSENLDPFQLPFDFDRLPMDANDEQLQTLSGNEVEQLTSDGQALRMVTLQFDSPGIKPFYLQVATSLQQVESAIALLRRLFWLGVPLALVAAGTASWLVSGGAVRRLRQLTREAQAMTPESIAKRRLPDAGNDEIGAMIRHIDGMFDRLDNGFKAQQAFIQDVSHELKTPLAIMHSQAQVFAKSPRDADEAARFAGNVAEEAQRLCRLVDSLLTLTCTEGRHRPIQRQDVSVNDVTVAALEETYPLAQEFGVSLQLHLPHTNDNGDDGDDMVMQGDPDMLNAMIGNLVRNAVRFAPRGTAVETHVRRVGDDAHITVRDHGPGVPADALEHIFDRFVQAGDRRGSGLGLAIARTVAELHGGHVTAENLPDDNGCRFIVSLPLVAPQT
jgi:signal transduction histidine kinase